MCENYRIKNPEKKLRQMLHTELGHITHNYYRFKEHYLGPSPTKSPQSNEKLPPTYQNYYVLTKSREKLIKSIHYEDSEIDGEKIEQLYRLSLKFATSYGTYPLLTIITKQPLEDCIQEYPLSHGVTLYPEIISFDEYNSKKHIEKIEEKICINRKFSKVEALDIIFIMKNVKKDHMKILKYLCELLNQMNIDEDYKSQLKRAMRFVVHIYADSEENIKKLEKILFKDESH